MRADAQRNRDRVLAAARRLVAQRGAAVGMDEIATAAGVAVGTLYRHFPTKTDLIAAVVEDAMSALADDTERAATALGAGADPAATFRDLFGRVAERHSTDLALKAAASLVGLAVPSDLRAEQSPQTARAYAAVVAVLEHSIAAGAVRPGTTLDDLVLLLDGVPPVVAGPDALQRYTAIVLRGLTT